VAVHCVRSATPAASWDCYPWLPLFALLKQPNPLLLQAPDLEEAGRLQERLVREFWPFFHPRLQVWLLLLCVSCVHHRGRRAIARHS